LTVTGFQTPSTRGAAVTVNDDGSYTYDPTGVAALEALTAGEEVTDTFTYTIADDNDVTATATVSITVAGVNDPPEAADDSNSTAADTPLDVNAASGVLSNDSDVDDDNFTVVAFESTSSLGANVTVGEDGSYTYDPTGATDLIALTEGEEVVDTFTYTIEDEGSNQATATVSVTVTGVNDPPEAVDDSNSINADTVLAVNA
ncbi:Ig-like domain-containing protein, partial [Lyngbya sp. CCY1209]|uniref:Ig-like domain-containing protein n=1 Tax=Lyngbya sp. CCY1209 TaxID=2886103 RepID=UPI002D20EB9A